MLKRMISAAAICFAALCLIAPPALHAAEPDEQVLADIDQIFEQWRLGSNVPGLVYGIVKDGRLVAVKGLGIQDTVVKRAVNSDTLFRIASMSKAFTALAILKLRNEGKLSLDAPAETYVPEMRGWAYPTKDSRKIRVRDLLNHVAGFVTDDPWGDRQQPLTEAEFTAMLKSGVPFSRPAGVAMEYSNFGYATLGRIISNVSGKRYQDYIRDNFLSPLGMSSTTYDIAKSPVDRRAIGYRWQENNWVREPDMADGVFGAMGGIETSANDYSRWVGLLLSAWPPRDGPDSGPVSRATVREIVEGSNFPAGSMRASEVGAPCRTARAYGMAWYIMDDCDLGRILTHGGGYPGYGSRVLLLPDKGIGIFALANKTYAGPSVPVLKAALALVATGAFPDRQIPVSQGVAGGYEIARAIWTAGEVSNSKAGLAMNFLMDRDEPHWKRELAKLKAEVGACPASEDVTAKTAMEGTFAWTCEHGRIQGGFLLAPTNKLALQALKFEIAKP
jgi:CubicO group peptidase (beta-lactamase class C family)